MADVNDSPKIFNPVDETFNLDDGTKLRIHISFPKILENLRKYLEGLQQTRNLPLNSNEINSADALVIWALDHARKHGMHFETKQEEAQYAVKRARYIYEHYTQIAAADAALLAMVTYAENALALSKEALPYPPTVEEEPLPGLEHEYVPPLNIKLNSPVERRVKRLHDILDSHPNVYLKVHQHVELLGALLLGEALEETDEAGFQSNAVNGQVSEKTSTKRAAQK